MDSDVMQAMQGFVRRYNPERSVERAGRAALLSALQRNRTYAAGVASWERQQLRGHWTNVLMEMASGYERARDLKSFRSDIVVLRDEINHQFRPLLCNGGLRIAHAQKSLSVFLKHLWCIGLVTEPPACPVDRIILGLAGAPESLRTWTTVNSMDEYDRQLTWLADRAVEESRTLAAWELIRFPVPADEL